jgi:hypothetical protein
MLLATDTDFMHQETEFTRTENDFQGVYIPPRF